MRVYIGLRMYVKQEIQTLTVLISNFNTKPANLGQGKVDFTDPSARLGIYLIDSER